MIGSRAEGFDAAAFGKVAVVMGGWSAEREVSLMSGEQILEALVGAGIDAHAVDAGRDVASVLLDEAFARAFLILHGPGGEDGTVQAALDLARIPYTGSGVLGSALSMDKQRARELVSLHGVPIARGRCVRTLAAAREIFAELGAPVVVKPVSEGSSIGVGMVGGPGTPVDLPLDDVFDRAFAAARRHGTVLVEERLPGPEVTAAVVGDRCLPLVSIRPASGFYDYHAKYLAEDTAYDCPARLDAAVAEETARLALVAFRALGCSGWGRVDFMLDHDGAARFIECNTAPGMTSHSLVPMAARAEGTDFQSLCIAVLAETLDRGGHAP